MRDYAKISPKFWIGPTGKAIRKIGPIAQVLSMYLMTSPHANMLGVYHLPIAYITADTGIPFEGASETLDRLCEVDFCSYDRDSEVVFIHEMARFQIGDQLKPKDNQVEGVRREYRGLPENPFLSAFFDKYSEAFHLDEKRFPKAPSKPLVSQEQEQEKEQEQEQDSYAPPALPPTRPEPQKSSESETALQASCRETLKAYASAYWDRYQAEPVVNAKVRSQIKQFCQRLCHDEAPLVAAFYVTHQSSFYVRKCHDIGSMLSDAEKLRTEWATNRQVTGVQAMQADRTQSNMSAADEAMRILESQRAA